MILVKPIHPKRGLMDLEIIATSTHQNNSTASIGKKDANGKGFGGMWLVGVIPEVAPSVVIKV